MSLTTTTAPASANARAWISGRPASSHWARISRSASFGGTAVDRMRAFVHETLTTSLRRTAAAPVLGKTLAVVVAGNGHQALVRRTVELAAQAVQDHHDLIRDKVRLESPV